MCLLVRRGKPACCLRMKVLHGEGLATHSNGCPQVLPSLNKRKNLGLSASKDRVAPKTATMKEWRCTLEYGFPFFPAIKKGRSSTALTVLAAEGGRGVGEGYFLTYLFSVLGPTSAP